MKLFYRSFCFLIGFLLIASGLKAQVDAAPINGSAAKKIIIQNKRLLPMEFAYNLADSVLAYDPNLAGNGNAGVIYFNGEFWVSKWASNEIVILDSLGSVDTVITITGVTGIRSFTTDGTSIFAGSADDFIYAIDPVNRKLDSTISLPSSSVGARMTAYDAAADSAAGGFWIANFTSAIELYSRSGTLLQTIPQSTHGVDGIYGGAVDTVTPGGPYLAIYNQGVADQARIDYIEIATGQPAGFVYNTHMDLNYTQTNNPDPAIAGGLFISDTYDPNHQVIIGVLQGVPDVLFGYENTVYNCTQSSGLTATLLSSGDVQLSWNPGGGVSWNVEYGPKGFIPGTGTTISTSTSSYLLTGLPRNRAFDFYVEDSCAGSGLSFWAGPMSFNTPFETPYYQNFENFGSLSSGIQNVEGWNSVETSAPNWQTGTSTGSSGTGPEEDHTIGSGGTFVYLETSGGSLGSFDSLISPLIMVGSNADTVDFEFWYHMHGSDMGSLEIYFDTNGVSTPIDTIVGEQHPNQSDPWTKYTTKLANLQGQAVRFIFKGIRGNGFQGDMAIDDIRLMEPPSCIRPSNLHSANLTDSSVTIAWTENNLATEWVIEYGPSGFRLGSGMTDTAYIDTNITLSGLAANTAYQVYVKSVCGRNDSSIWEGPFRFVTLCTAVNTYPYLQSFNTYLPTCWDEAGSGTPATGPSSFGSSNWSSDDYLNDASNGPGVSINLYSNTREEWVISEPFDLSAGGSQGFELRINVGVTNWNSFAPDSMGSDDEVHLLISTDGGLTWTSIYNWTRANQPPHTGTKLTLPLTSYTGSSNIFAIYATDGTVDDPEDYDFHFDEFEIRITPTCIEPTNLTASNVTSSSATLNWVEVNNATEWLVEYGPAGFAKGTGTVDTARATPSLNVSGLTDNTSYEFYVRAICGRNDTSYWTVPSRFMTTILFPYFQDFEAFGQNTNGIFNVQGWNSTNTSGLQWETGTSTTSSNTGPEEDHTIGQGGTFAYLETSGGSQGDFDSLISPEVYIDTSVHAFALVFWYHMYGATMGDLEVYIDTNGTSNLVTTISGEQQSVQNDPWLLSRSVLTGYEGSRVRIIFKGSRGSSFTGDMAIDDVALVQMYPNDAGIASVVSPSGAICPGTIAPVVEVENTGNNTITTVEVVSILNGVADTITYNTSIPVGQTANVTLDSITLSPGASYNWTVYTQLPNGVADTANANDTLRQIGMRTGLLGNYTIDASQPASGLNYQSFSAAAADLGNMGVCGPVVFNVASGSYFEHVALNEISGVSTSNTVTFDGSDSTLVVLSHDGSVDRPTLLLNGADHITFKNMTIEATGSAGTAVHLMNQADHNTFANNILQVDTSSTSSSLNVILMTASTTSTSSEGNNGNYVVFKNNVIAGGYYQARIEGDGNSYGKEIHFLNNQFLHGYRYAVYADNMVGAKYNGNIITSERRHSGGDGLYLFDQMHFEISNNYVNVPDYGIYVSDANSDSVPAQRAAIYNNMVVSDGGYGLLLYDAVDVDIYHNTVSVHGSNPAVRIDNSLTDNVDLRNNIFASASSEALLYDLPGTSVRAMDNNIYYTATGSVLIEFDGTTYADLVSFQTAHPAFNANSLEGDPIFTSYDDLHIVGPLANNAGDNSVGITVDIDGDPRPIGTDTIVDIGADEYELPPVDVTPISLVQPTKSLSECFSSAENVEISISNFGTDSLDFAADSLVITLNVSGASTQTISAVVKDNSLNNGLPLAALDTLTVPVGTVNMSALGTYYFDISLSMAQDGDITNNTLSDSITVLAPSGGQIVGFDTICSGDTVRLKVENAIGAIQWQSAIAGVFTDIPGADSTELNVSPRMLTEYRVVTCGAGFSDTLIIEPITLSQPIAFDSTLVITCGDTGVVALVATSANANATFEWFDVPTGGNPLTAGGNILSISANGDTLYYQNTSMDTNSPAIDTFYVQEVVKIKGRNTSSVLITEADLSANDAFEIQNVTNKTIDVTGWTVAVSDSYTNINDVSSTTQVLNGTLAPGQILTWSDVSSSPNYWGSNLFWNGGSGGWIIIIDSSGEVVDYVAWEWTQNDIYSFNDTINGHFITLDPDHWVGSGITGSSYTGIERLGNSDNNTAADFSLTTTSMGSTNANIQLPFPSGDCFSTRDTAIAIIDCIVGVEEVGNSFANISVRPNPSRGIFHIVGNNVTEAVEISIFNTNGKVVYQSNGTFINNFDEPVDISNLAKGLYFVKLQSGAAVEMKKIVIQ